MLRLLDDPAEEVREKVEADFLSLETDLPALLSQVWDTLSPALQQAAQLANQTFRRKHFEKTWLEFLQQPSPLEALEQAMASLSYLDGEIDKPALRPLIDDLAEAFARSSWAQNAEGLVGWLFREKKYAAPSWSFYHPRNSDLVSVISRREGLQISLAIMAMLVGKRLNISLFGLNVPRHFLLATGDQELGVIFDVFNQGKIIRSEALLESQGQGAGSQGWLAMKATTPMIIARVIRNLIYAHQAASHPEWTSRYQAYLAQLQAVDPNL